MADNNSDQQNNIVMPPITPPDWTISELYNRSWQAVKKYKVLWVFGMAVVGLASGAGVNNFSSFQGSEDFTQTFSSTGSSVITDTILRLLTSVPTSLYVLLGIELVLLIVAGTVTTLIGSAWANASLIHSVQTALGGEKPTIKESSEKAFASIKSLIWLQVVPTLVIVLASFLVFGTLAGGIALTSGFLRILSVILLIAAVLSLIYISLMLALSNIWALRIIVLEKKKAFDSLKAGFEISKNKFWSMILLGLVNSILSMIVVGSPLAIIVGFIVGGILTLNGNSSVGVVLLVIGIILMIFFVLASVLISGILTAFKASVWTVAYHKIKGKYEKR